MRQPRRFAHILGTLLLYASPEQVLFATGCAVSHVDPIVRAFADFEIPEDLREGYDYPEVTREIKRKILGENMAKLLDIDADTMRRVKDDAWAKRRAAGKAAPWSAHRKRVNAPDYPYPGYDGIGSDATAEAPIEAGSARR